MDIIEEIDCVMEPAPGEITELLSRVAGGDKSAESRLLPLVYQELRRSAAQVFRSEQPGHTLQATALVHEAYLRLTGNPISWQNRTHFFAVAARMMRRVLIDHARRHQANKRFGVHISLDSAVVFSSEQCGEFLALDEAMERLAELDGRQCRIVELRFFTGLSEAEVAELLGVSVRTVKRDWQMAKAWLHGELVKAANDSGAMGTT